MKVIDFIKSNRLLEYKLTFEFRKNNLFIKEETIDNVYNLSKQLLDKDIDNWFVSYDNKIVIDLSSDFQYGGGTDSIYSRMMQLIKTSITNTENKKIYLYLDGKQVNVIGGEGIMITQPLTEQSLEI